MRTACKALFICHLRWKHAAHLLPACDVIRNPDSNCLFCIFYAVVYVWLGQTSVNGNTTNLERVLYLCLALEWRWSDVPLVYTFTCGKTHTFFNMQKMCAEVDVHSKWRTNSDARPANHNALTKILHFFVCWTCVMVCFTWPLERVSAWQVYRGCVWM